MSCTILIALNGTPQVLRDALAEIDSECQVDDKEKKGPLFYQRLDDSVLNSLGGDNPVVIYGIWDNTVAKLLSQQNLWQNGRIVYTTILAGSIFGTLNVNSLAFRNFNYPVSRTGPLVKPDVVYECVKEEFTFFLNLPVRLMCKKGKSVEEAWKEVTNACENHLKSWREQLRFYTECEYRYGVESLSQKILMICNFRSGNFFYSGVGVRNAKFPHMRPPAGQNAGGPQGF